jgi:outer membrane protein TolC
VGLQLTIPLFSGLSYFSERNAMAAREAQAQSQEEQVRLQFAFREAKALKELSAAHAVIDASRTAFGLARESVKEAQKNFRLATIDYLQFLTVQQNFLNAEIAKNQAEYSYVQALSNYMVAAGHPLTKLVDALQGAGGSP